MGKRILLLGVYGMEMVECGGVLAKNVKAGGQSFASLMLTSKQTMADCDKAAKVLGVSKVYYHQFETGKLDCDYQSKLKLIRTVRETKPDIIITQDPEHIIADLDPDRRPAMTLILESVALASRAFALEEIPGLEPHPIPHIYYMSPVRPNCTVNIADVWDLKEKGMDVLESQMTFSGQHYETGMSEKELDVIVPGFKQLDSYYKKGRAMHTAIDKAYHMYWGCCGHGRFALAEPYRYEGVFEFEELV